MAKRKNGKKSLKNNYPLIVAALILLAALLILAAVINYHPSSKPETPAIPETPEPQVQPHRNQLPSQSPSRLLCLKNLKGVFT